MAGGDGGMPLALKPLGLFDGGGQIGGLGEGADPSDQVLLEALIGGPLRGQTVIEALEGCPEAPFEGPSLTRLDLTQLLPAGAHLAFGALGLAPIDPGPVHLVEEGLKLRAYRLPRRAGGLALTGALLQPGLAEGVDLIRGGLEARPQGLVGGGPVLLQGLPFRPQGLEPFHLGGERQFQGHQFLHRLAEALAMGVRPPAPPLLQLAQAGAQGPQPPLEALGLGAGVTSLIGGLHRGLNALEQGLGMTQFALGQGGLQFDQLVHGLLQALVEMVKLPLLALLKLATGVNHRGQQFLIRAREGGEDADLAQQFLQDGQGEGGGLIEGRPGLGEPVGKAVAGLARTHQGLQAGLSRLAGGLVTGP